MLVVYCYFNILCFTFILYLVCMFISVTLKFHGHANSVKLGYICISFTYFESEEQILQRVGLIPYRRTGYALQMMAWVPTVPHRPQVITYVRHM